jgi:hypothetical protein
MSKQKKPTKPPRWPIDPNVKGKFACLPPAGHVRRCQGTNKYRLQCEKWARKGSNYCKRHGGYNRKYNRPVNWYAREATDTLAQRLAALAEMSPDERLALTGEIDLARELTSKAVDLYDRAHYGDKSEKLSDELKVLSREALRDAISHVSEVVTKAARAHSLSANVIGVQHIEHLAAQFTKIIEDLVVPLDEQVGATCLKRLNEVKLPVAEGSGEATADRLREAVRQMDNTIGSTD